MEQVPADGPEVRKEPYGRNLRNAFRLGRNILILDAKPTAWEALESVPSKERRIDVWWWGDATSELMLLFAYLMTRSDEWADATIRILAACPEPESEQTVENIRKRLDDVRIEAEPEAVIEPNAETVVARSMDASLVFLPLRLKGNQPLDPFGGFLEELLPRLPSVALLLAAEDIDLDAEPEEGKAASIAAAVDAVEDTRKRAIQKQEAADKAKRQAEQKFQEVQQAALTDADSEKLERLKLEAEEAQKTAEQASRKVAKAAAKAEDAARDAEAAGAQITDPKK